MRLPDMMEAKKRTKDNNTEFIYVNPVMNNKFMDKKYFIRTYGCQMNVHDSEEIAGILENLGFKPTEEMEDADLVLLNTCAIRENAHDKFYGFLGRCKHIKEKENKDLIICICGCMAQEKSVIDDLMKNHRYVDLVFGTHNIHELPEFLMNLDGKQDIEVKSNDENVYEVGETFVRDSKYSAWVNIMYGCDKFCTYCIVPYTRGKERSRKSSDILKEVCKLKQMGYKEVTLLGQNVNAYGRDREDEISFAELLEETAKTGIERIRFVTSHPWNFTDEMINIIAKYDNIMPYIHLPLQSGSDRILKLMGRRYTKEEYIELYNKLKNTVPNAAITTDIIVGFPGETEEDFEETLDVVNKCKYDGAFTFIFSPRVGTPAAEMKDDTPLEVKEDRLHRLNDLINKYSNEANSKYLGQKVKVLLTDHSDRDKYKLAGYTETMKLVNVDCDESLLGEIVEVTITDTKSFSMNGKVE